MNGLRYRKPLQNKQQTRVKRPNQYHNPKVKLTQEQISSQTHLTVCRIAKCQDKPKPRGLKRQRRRDVWLVRLDVKIRPITKYWP